MKDEVRQGARRVHSAPFSLVFLDVERNACDGTNSSEPFGRRAANVWGMRTCTFTLQSAVIKLVVQFWYTVSNV